MENDYGIIFIFLKDEYTLIIYISLRNSVLFILKNICNIFHIHLHTYKFLMSCNLSINRIQYNNEDFEFLFQLLLSRMEAGNVKIFYVYL